MNYEIPHNTQRATPPEMMAMQFLIYPTALGSNASLLGAADPLEQTGTLSGFGTGTGCAKGKCPRPVIEGIRHHSGVFHFA